MAQQHGRRRTPGIQPRGPAACREAILGLFALCLCGCRQDRPGASPPPPLAADTATTVQADATAGDEAAEPTTLYTNRFSSVWTEDSARVTRPASPLTTLRAVRTAAHPDFDRVVFDFGRDHVPGYDVRYAGGPEPGCVPVAAVPREGSAALRISLKPARAHTGAGGSSLEARALRPDMAELRTLVIECDNEARLTWIAGLAAHHPFRVFELRAPARLVVDIAH